MDIALGEEGVELELVLEIGELEWLAGGEDDDLLGEVAVVGIVKAVFDKVPHEHLDFSRAFFHIPEVVGCYHGVLVVFIFHVLLEEGRSLLPVALVCFDLVGTAGSAAARHVTMLLLLLLTLSILLL